MNSGQSLPMKKRTTHLVALTVLGVALATLYPQLEASGQGTAFTYQGRFFDGANPANGNYDFRFNVFDAPSNGGLVAGPKTNPAVVVSNGLFTVTLDCGPGILTGPP